MALGLIGGTIDHAKGLIDPYRAARRGALMAGGPAQVAKKILDLRSELGADRFLGQADLGGMPPQLVRDSIQRFGDIVAPAVQHVLIG